MMVETATAQIRLQPWQGAQADFLADDEHFLVGLQSGQGSGKTWAGARKLVMAHLHSAAISPTTASMAVAPTYQDAVRYVVPELIRFLDEVCSVTAFRYQWKPSLMQFEITLPGVEHPGIIYVVSGETPERITGIQVGEAWLDESPRYKRDDLNPLNDAWDQILGRVRTATPGVKCQIMCTHTPEGDTTKTHEMFSSGRGDTALYIGSTKDNPLMAEFYERQRRMLSADLVEQYLHGQTISIRKSKVYPDFDPAKHLDDTLEWDFARPLCLACDWNISPGCHAEVFQHDEAEDVFAFIHEIHGPALTVRGIGLALARLVPKPWPWAEPLHVYGDASGRARGIGTGRTQLQVLAEALDSAGIPHDFRIGLKNPAVVDRLNAVNCGLLDVEGKAHVRIHSRCVRLVEDMKRMRYDDKGEPDKSNRLLSHASDAMGYALTVLRPMQMEIPEKYTSGRVVFADYGANDFRGFIYSG